MYTNFYKLHTNFCSGKVSIVYSESTSHYNISFVASSLHKYQLGHLFWEISKVILRIIINWIPLIGYIPFEQFHIF